MPITFASCAPESDRAEPFRFADLWQAYLACRHGKRRSAAAQRYSVTVFDRLAETADALSSGMWKPATAQSFVVTRPKASVGCAARHNDTRSQLPDTYEPSQSGAYTPIATNRPKLEYGQSPGAMTKPCLTGFQWM